MSKIIQIQFKQGKQGSTLYGLDDEGIVWFLADDGVKEWLPLVKPVEPETTEAEIIG